ncbi:unnamed protein product [Sphagnum tenellum]
MEEEIALSKSTWYLCCFLHTQKSAIDELMAMGMQQSPALLFLLYSLQQLRGLALKRFSTTLEEEESIEGYRTDIYLREEKAIKEHFAMHQQLEVDRKVRADAFAEYQENERLIYRMFCDSHTCLESGLHPYECGDVNECCTWMMTREF